MPKNEDYNSLVKDNANFNYYVEDDLNFFFEYFQKKDCISDKYVIIADYNLFLYNQSKFVNILIFLINKGSIRGFLQNTFPNVKQVLNIKDELDINNVDTNKNKDINKNINSKNLNNHKNINGNINNVNQEEHKKSTKDNYEEVKENTNNIIENLNLHNNKISNCNVRRNIYEQISRNCEPLIYEKSYINSFEIENVLIIITNIKKYQNNFDIYQEFIKILSKHMISSQSELFCFADRTLINLIYLLCTTHFKGMKYYLFPANLISCIEMLNEQKNSLSINLRKIIKNSISIHGVFILTNFCKSSSEIEYKLGISEILKFAIIKDGELYKKIRDNNLHYFKKNIKYFLKKYLSNRNSIIKKSITNKKFLNILNFGKTIGNAVGNAFAYKHNYNEYINYGMYYELKILYELNIIDMLLIIDIEQTMKKYNLKFKLEKTFLNYYINNILEFICKEKKLTGNKISIVHLLDINKIHTNILIHVPLCLLIKVLCPTIYFPSINNLLHLDKKRKKLSC